MTDPELSVTPLAGGRFRSLGTLLLLLAVMLPVQLHRASLEGSWWVDENESVLLASGPTARLIDYTASDTNPPGYFLLLKPWMALGNRLVRAPGVWWPRLPSVAVWVLLACFLWFMGRRLCGPVPGAVLALAICTSPPMSWLAEARPFGIALALGPCCGFLLWAGVEEARSGGSRGAGWGWLLYALLAELALWTHLLTLPVLGVLALFGLGAALRLRHGAPWLLRDWLLGHTLIALLYVPWAVHLAGQVAARQAETARWMMSPDLLQWLLIFVRWFPLGSAEVPPAIWLPFGAAALLVPLLAALAAAWLGRGPRRSDLSDRRLLITAAGAFAVPIVFTLTLLAMQRWRDLPVFFTSRYPAMTAGFWITGLVLLSTWTVGRMGWRPSVLWVLMAPWLLAGWVGASYNIADRHVTIFQRQKAAPFMPPAGATLFVMPESLAPYVRGALSSWQVRPAAELPCALASLDEAWVLDLNYLHMLDEERHAVLSGAIRNHVLSRKVKERYLPPPQFYTLYHLTEIASDRAQNLCAQGVLRPEPPPIPVNAAAVALPESQRQADGWWWPDVDSRLRYLRWWDRPEARLVFDRSVPEGEYVLHYRGYCARHGREPRILGLRFEGMAARYSVRHEAGEIVVDVPVHLVASVLPPILHLAHPMGSLYGVPAKYPPINRVSSELRYAWLERPIPAQPGPVVLARKSKRVPSHGSFGRR
jgi:hypothetical protein